MARKTRQSRRKTPWDNESEMTPTQEFIHDQHYIHYNQRHPSILESGESALINSYTPVKCLYCKCIHSLLKMFLNAYSGFLPPICK